MKYKYCVNVEEHVEFLEYCDNLDNLCINLASQYSESWFGKKLSPEILVKYLVSTYNNETDNDIYLEIDIIDLSHLDKLADYNNNDSMNLLVKISNIEFFKKTFRINIELASILEGIPDANSYESEDEESINDFNEILDNEVNVTNEVYENNSINQVINQVNDIVTIDNDNKITNIIQESQENKIDMENDMESVVINTDTIDFDDIVSKETLNELETLITEKKNQQKRYLMNAERARRASDNLNIKAKDTESEIREYENKLKSMNDMVSSNFN